MSQDIARKTTSHPIRLQARCVVIFPTTALARPLVHALGVEFHEEDVKSARVGVPIQGAPRFACHPGISNVVHLRQLVCWALQCAADACGKSKKSKKNDRIMRRRTGKKVKPSLKDDTKLTTACPAVSGRDQFNSNSFNSDKGGLLICNVCFSPDIDSQWMSSDLIISYD